MKDADDKITCSICGEPISGIGLLTMKRMSGNAVCKKCRLLFPSVFNIRQFDFETIKSMIEYQKEHGAEFECTAHLDKLYLDEINHKLAYSEKGRKTLKQRNNVFRLGDIDDLSLTLSEPTVNRKTQEVFCDILLTVKLIKPAVSFCKPIKRKVLCDYARVDKDHVRFNEPNEMAVIRSIINQMLQNRVSELKKLFAEQQFFSSHVNGDVSKKKLREAEILFMLDEGYTFDEAKKVFKEYMKAFHPDKSKLDDSYAQKINDAFETIKKEFGK